jgi:prophage regulatory protein
MSAQAALIDPPGRSPDEIVFLSIDEVCRRTTLSASEIYRQVKAGTFPAPVHVTTKRCAHLESEIAEWQRRRIQLSRAA